MSPLNLLEQLANSTHHDSIIAELAASQNNNLKQAFLQQDQALLISHFSNTDIIANETHVLQI